MSPDEERFIKCVDDLYFESTGEYLPGWRKEIILKIYRFHRDYPNAKVVMGRKGPIVVVKKEEER